MKFRLILLLLLLNACAIAQKTTDKKADALFIEAMRYMNYGEYNAAQVNLEKALARDNGFLDAKINLAQVYLVQEKPDLAKKLMLEILEQDPAYDARVYFNLGLLSQMNSEYADSKKYFEGYLKYADPRDPLISQARLAVASADFATKAMANPVKYDPKNMGININTEFDEYFPALTADEDFMMFTRAVKMQEGPYDFNEDFFFAESEDKVWKPSYNPGPPINTFTNEGAPTLSADGKYIIFTACDLDGSLNYGRGRKGYGSCDLFVSERNGNKWSPPVNMGRTINSGNWETQPSFASDGKTLYFIRGKSRGSSKEADIYVSTLTEKGWGMAQPLPKNINTPRSEESVFIHPDNQTLYFSSNGHIGMGDMDIYLSRRQADGSWGNPENLGYPINTSGHENSFNVAASGEYAIISSDREGGFGGMDLYTFELDESIKPQKITYLTGTIKDAKTKEPLSARFELIDLETDSVIAQASSDKVNGSFLVVLPSSKAYALIAEKENYLYLSENFSLDLNENSLHYERSFFLQPFEKGGSVILKNVFFDTDKFELKPASKTELNRLVSMLNNNPEMKIEVAGHTDNQGNAAANKVLSENRAKAVYQFLIDANISADRLSYKGYGAEKPLADNATEEGRAQNRRTEFTMVD